MFNTFVEVTLKAVLGMEDEAVFHLGESVDHTAFRERSLKRFLASNIFIGVDNTTLCDLIVTLRRLHESKL